MCVTGQWELEMREMRTVRVSTSKYGWKYSNVQNLVVPASCLYPDADGVKMRTLYNAAKQPWGQG